MRIEVANDTFVWAFFVVIFSIAVDMSRSRALLRAAKKHHSQALEADALHFATDVWSSCVVLFGLVGVVAARRMQVPWLADTDSVAALGVAGIVVWVSVRLGKKSLDDLLDRIPDDLHDKVARAAGNVAGVESVSKVRMRRSGPQVFADVTLSVGQAISFERAHEISDEAAEAVRGVAPSADVVVHAEPLALSNHDITTQVRILAARHGLGAHAIRLYDENSQRWLELHLEVPESLTLEEAHRQATAFESDVRSGRARHDADRLSPGAGGRQHGDHSGRAGRCLRPFSPPWTTSSTAMPDCPVPQRQGPAGGRRDAGFLPLPARSTDVDRRRPRLDRES